MIGKILITILIFLAGFSSALLINLLYAEIEKPLIIGGVSWVNAGLETPGDWIQENQIHVYENAIVIDVEGASLGKYAATGSMNPVLNQYSNGIRIVPKSEEQIGIGDIITFEQDNQFIIHRVIDKGEDKDGVYFITKGDNNNITDGKIRFQDIKYVTIGMLW